MNLTIRKGARAALAYLVRTGRMRDRVMGRGLPLVTSLDIIRELQRNSTFTVRVNASHMAVISGDTRSRLPNFLVGLIAAAAQPRNALEIGTGSGGGTCQIAAQLREGGSVVTLAPPVAWIDPRVQPLRGQLTEPESLRQRHGRFPWEGTPLANRIELIRADSRVFDYRSLGRKFDFAFVDASHFYEAVRKDTEGMLPSLADGAVVLWHDYQSSILSHGVDRYLHELAARTSWPIRVVEYTTLAIQIRR